jgi:hypothetical protein
MHFCTVNNKPKTMKTFLLVLVLLTLKFGYSQTNKVFSIGNLDSNTYSNKFFGITLKIDSSWKIMNRKELSQLMEDRQNALEETNGKKYEVQKGSNILLSLTGDTLENIPQVLLSSLDLFFLPTIKNETDYLVDYAKRVTETYKNYDLQMSVSEIGQKSINNKIFFTSIITIKAEGYITYQKRYSLKFGNTLLNIMANYNSSSTLKQCERLIANLRWD